MFLFVDYVMKSWETRWWLSVCLNKDQSWGSVYPCTTAVQMKTVVACWEESSNNVNSALAPEIPGNTEIL